MVFGELGSPNQGGPGKKGLGCLGETWFSTKRTGWVALWRLHWAVEKGTKPQPCCQLEQGATFSSSFCLVHEKKR